MLKLLGPFLLLLAMVGASVLSDRPAPRADFAFCNAADATTLDFARMSWMQDLRIARLLFEGLTRNDVLSREFRPVPAVAERWEVSPDARTYTFHLRPGLRWSNGEPLRAEDFRFSWRRLMLPDFAADYTGFFMAIEGAPEFFAFRKEQLRDAATRLPAIADRAARAREAGALWEAAQRKFDELVGLSAPDERTLVVRLRRPVPYFLDFTSFPIFYPVYPPLVRAHEQVEPGTGAILIDADWTKPPNLVGNGAFTLRTWKFKREMRFERNPHYWNQSEVRVDTMSIPSIDDPNAQILAFRTGALDWLSDATPGYVSEMLAQKWSFIEEHRAQYDRLKDEGWDEAEIARRLPDDPRNHIHAFPAFGTYFWNFNCTSTLPDGRPNPFADARVRRAFTMAVDKRVLVEQIRRRWEPVARSLIPPGSIPGYDPPQGLAFDPAGARTLLAECGYPGGQGFITVELLFNPDSGHEVIAQFLARCWQENLGVSCRLVSKELAITREEIKGTRFITSRGSWYGDYGDPLTFLDLHRTGDGNNDRRYSNPVYDALLERAQDTPDRAQRLAILRQAEEMIVQREAPVLPLFHYVNHQLFNAHKVTGITSHPRSEQALQFVEIMGDAKGTEQPRMMERARGKEPAP